MAEKHIVPGEKPGEWKEVSIDTQNPLFKSIDRMAASVDSIDPTVRAVVLDEARKCVLSDRNKEYGSPEDNFSNIASLWESYFISQGKPLAISTADVALLMLLVKVARLSTNPAHRDSWVDIAGYAACGAECAAKN